MANEQENYLNTLIQKCKDFENSLSSDYRKKTGSYFTGFDMAKTMVCDLIVSFRKKYGKEHLYSRVFLEPCGGAGNFIYCYLYEISKIDFTYNQINQIVQNIYYCDANKRSFV